MFHVTTWSFFQSEVIRICAGEKTRDDIVNMLVEFSHQLLKNKAYEGYRGLIYYPLSNMTTVAYNSSIPRAMTLFENSGKVPRKNTAGSWLSASSDPLDTATQDTDKSKPTLTQAEIDAALMQEFLRGRETKYYLHKNHIVYQNMEKSLEFLKMMKKIVYHIYELKNERFEIYNANHMKLLRKFKKNMAVGLPKATTKKQSTSTTDTDSKSTSMKETVMTNFTNLTSILKSSNGSSSRSTTPTRTTTTTSTTSSTAAASSATNTTNPSPTSTTSSASTTDMSTKKTSTKSTTKSGEYHSFSIIIYNFIIYLLFIIIIYCITFF
jgi:hypothetical protein